MSTPTIASLLRHAEDALTAVEDDDRDEATDELEALVRELRPLRDAAPDAVLADELASVWRRLRGALRLAHKLDDLDLGRGRRRAP